MDELNRGKKPLIKSQLSATLEGEHWLEVHTLEFEDAEGLIWSLKVLHDQRDHPQDPRKILWFITFQLTSSSTIEDFQGQGVLNSKEDERLISFFAPMEKIPIFLKKVSANGNSEGEAIKNAKALLPKYCEQVEGKNLISLKRKAIALAIEEKCRFGRNRFERKTSQSIV